MKWLNSYAAWDNTGSRLKKKNASRRPAGVASELKQQIEGGRKLRPPPLQWAIRWGTPLQLEVWDFSENLK